jgi:hypothetical protein
MVDQRAIGLMMSRSERGEIDTGGREFCTGSEGSVVERHAVGGKPPLLTDYADPKGAIRAGLMEAASVGL